MIINQINEEGPSKWQQLLLIKLMYNFILLSYSCTTEKRGDFLIKATPSCPFLAYLSDVYKTML